MEGSVSLASSRQLGYLGGGKYSLWPCKIKRRSWTSPEPPSFTSPLYRAPSWSFLLEADLQRHCGRCHPCCIRELGVGGGARETDRQTERQRERWAVWAVWYGSRQTIWEDDRILAVSASEEQEQCCQMFVSPWWLCWNLITNVIEQEMAPLEADQVMRTGAT